MLRLIGTVVLGLLIVSYVLLQQEVVKRRLNYRTSDKILMVADKDRPEVARAVAFGFDNTLADLLWIRGIQFFGGNFSSLTDTDKKEGFINLFENLVILDPRFTSAWKFGGFVFNESCGDPKTAVEFLLRGAYYTGNENQVSPRSLFHLLGNDICVDRTGNRNDWSLLFDAGFIAFYNLKDFANAKQYFLEASKRPGAPSHVARMAIEMDLAGGQFLVAWEHYNAYVEEARLKGDAISEKIASDKLDKLYLDEAINYLNPAIELYRNEHDGKYPDPLLHDLIDTGTLLRAVEAKIQAEPDLAQSYQRITADAQGDVRRLLRDRKSQSPIVMWVDRSGVQERLVIDSRINLSLMQQQNINTLQAMVEHYQNNEPGKPLQKLDDILSQEWAKGLSGQIPADPLGGEYFFDPLDQRVKVRNTQW